MKESSCGLVLFWVSNFSNTLLKVLSFGSFEGSFHLRKCKKKTKTVRAIDNECPSAASQLKNAITLRHLREVRT